jgi:protocatechuate 3,4-dioxygenase beta subunit
MMVGTASAQKKDITGKVIDQSTGMPMAGVSVITDKKKVLTVTDEKGNYTFKPSSSIKS